jgi:hypothetical protein
MPNYGSMSRKRLQEINDLLISKFNISEKTTKEIMDGICSIINYNPDQKTYTPEKGQGQMSWRARKAEELGVSKASIARGKYKKST